MKQKTPFHIYCELVPLQEAAATAYHIITERPIPLKDPNALHEVRDLVAIALTSVAPVLRVEDGGAAVPVTSAEVNERLFRRPARMDDLCMRRMDLLRAVESLKQAHVAFDRQHVLESIRKLA